MQILRRISRQSAGGEGGWGLVRVRGIRARVHPSIRAHILRPDGLGARCKAPGTGLGAVVMPRVLETPAVSARQQEAASSVCKAAGGSLLLGAGRYCLAVSARQCPAELSREALALGAEGQSCSTRCPPLILALSTSTAMS